MCFTSPMAPRHATPDLSIPVEACRPPFLKARRYEGGMVGRYENIFPSFPHTIIQRHNTLSAPGIQQPFHVFAAEAVDPYDLIPRRVTGYDLHAGPGDAELSGQKSDQRFVRRAVHGRRCQSDLEPSAFPADDLVLRCPGLDPDGERGRWRGLLTSGRVLPLPHCRT